MDVIAVCGWLAAVCLTVYPAVAITRMVRRRSSLDYSLPGLVLVIIGLAAYLVTVWESPGWLTGTISLGWNVAMLITVAVFRWPVEEVCEKCRKPSVFIPCGPHAPLTGLNGCPDHRLLTRQISRRSALPLVLRLVLRSTIARMRASLGR